MILNGKPLTSMPSQERLSATLTFEPVNFRIPSAFLTIFNFAVTLTFQLLTSKSNQFKVHICHQQRCKLSCKFGEILTSSLQKKISCSQTFSI